MLQGQQEDAEEFLSFILNGIHEEMVESMKLEKRKLFRCFKNSW